MLVTDRPAPADAIVTDNNNKLLNKLGRVLGGLTVNIAVAPNGDVIVVSKFNLDLYCYIVKRVTAK